MLVPDDINRKLLNLFLTPVKSQRETYARLPELCIEFVHRTLDILVVHVKTEVIWKHLALVLDWC